MLDEMYIAGRRNRFFAAFDAPASAATVLPERAEPNNAIENEFKIDDAALPLLVGERKMLAEEIARIMLREAARYGASCEVRVCKVTPMPARGFLKVVEIKQKVALNGKRGEEYYDYLNDALTAWTRSLPEAQDKIVEEEILLDLDWNWNASEE